MTPYEQNVRIADAATPPAQTAPASGTVPVEGVPAIPEDALILITTRNLVLFPGTVLPITLGRQRSIIAAQTAIRLSRPVGLVLQRDPMMDDPMPVDLHRVGTEANLLRYVMSPDGGHHVICQGEQRFRVVEFLEGYPFFVARIVRVPESEATNKDIDARLMNLRNQATEILQLLPQTPAELVNAVQSVTSAPGLADLIASFTDITPAEKQELLETFDIERRLDRVSELLAYRLEVLRLSRKISDRTKETMDERQREFLLREQLKTIQNELGEGEDAKSQEIAELRQKIEKAGMPEEIETHAKKELARLERMPEAAGEYSMARTYLEWLIELPWAAEDEPPIDIAEARRMLDEVDKLGRGIQGDPASALLEVLDPEQNSTFRDNYLGVPFDLSRVMFICTANVIDNIPGPLRDRMEIIDLPGYTEDEKFEIAKRYLVKRQLTANGLTADQAEFTDEALHAIIRDYTREAGVRQLEREIGTALRSVAMQIAEGTATKVIVTPEDLHEMLGPRRFENEVAMRTSVPGVATGLAWTPVGGDILFIEATRIPGKGALILTGQLGEVMRESAQAAMTLVKARAQSLGLDPKLFESSDIHIHVPAGAIPKDGPSAGVAMFTALASLLTGRTVKSDTAMTGEISLRGLVLPVGGIKEKVVAAAAAGLATVILPARNRRDYEDIPEAARNKLGFTWAERVEEVVEAALEPAAAAPALEPAAQ